MRLGLVVVVLVPVCVGLCVGDEPKKKGVPPRLNKGKTPTPSPPDSKEVAENIKFWLKHLEDPKDGQLEATCVAGLFGNPPLGGGFDPPKEIKKLLLRRRLNYRFWEARKAAAWEFKHALENDIGALITILRDGLNDPHAEVREQAIHSLTHALDLLENGGPLGRKWQGDTKKSMLEKTEDFVDEIADLLITKGLNDENEDTAYAAYYALQDDERVPATRIRLRALRRLAERGQIHPKNRDGVKALLDDWTKAVRAK